MANLDILKIAKRLQALSQTGLHYVKDEFDQQRYSEIRELSIELAGIIADAPIEKIKELFTYERGFQTPKVDVRAVVMKNGKVLLNKEKSDLKWALPGGFADVNISPAENIVKEVFEESGLHVKAKRLLAVVDCNKHDSPPLAFHYYKLVFECELINGSFSQNSETEESGFFSFNELPPLSYLRNTPWLFKLIENHLSTNNTYFD